MKIDTSDLNMYDIIVIGGGASGMMSAITASTHGAKVLLLEKNKRLGEKLRITGGKRCNITNAEENVRIYLKNYGKAEQYLYSAFMKFGFLDTIKFFEDLKVPIKIEARKRAFPVSENANDVAGALADKLHRNGVTVLTNCLVTKIVQTGSTVTSVVCDKQIFKASQYIVASGGTSRPETGSTGDGFGWLASLGHTINSPNPSITPLALKESWVTKASGITAKEASITFYCGAERSLRLQGDILFTHFGISGPLILNNAYKVADLLQSGEVTAKIDLMPDVEQKTLDQKIVSVLHEYGSKQLKNVIQFIVPIGMSALVKELAKNTLDFEVKTSEVTKASRLILVNTIKNVPVTVTNLMGFEKAVVADGGVRLSEIDTRTMRSTLLKNLYITGDLLDINRPSGGFSLQLCWTSGYIAGLNAAQAGL